MTDRIEIKAALDVSDAGEITGTAWPFGSADRVGDMIEKGAFSGPATLPMLWSHDHAQVIGVWNEIAETAAGLTVKGKLLIDDLERAREVRAMVKAGAVSGLSIGFVTKDATEAEEGRNAATSEQIRLQREAEQVRTRAEEAGVTLSTAQVDQLAAEAIAGEDVRRAADKAASGGGKDTDKDKAGAGASERDQFADAVTRLKEEKAALDAEAVALIAAAGAGRKYADALEFARTRAELLTAAQRQGKAITPALSAEIDRLADAYVDAGNKAEAAADQMSEIETRGQRGAEALTGMFMSVLDGSKSAEEALADLLLQIAEAQMNKALMGFFGGGAGGGIAQTVGGLLGYASGGFTGAGGKYEPAGIVHKGEFVMSKAATARIGVSNLEGLHRAALRGYSDGGLVGATQKATQAAAPRSTAPAPIVNITGGAVTVNASGGSPEQNADLANQIAAETERAMRSVVRDELIRQMRPGAMMGRR